MPFWGVKRRPSPPWKPELIDTVALSRLVSSPSATVSEPSIVVAGSPSVYEVEPPDVVTVGASFTAVIVTVAVSWSDRSGEPPSLTTISRVHVAAGTGPAGV